MNQTNCIPTILIYGSVGKSSTLTYLKHNFVNYSKINPSAKFNILTFTLNETNNIESVFINDEDISKDIQETRNSYCRLLTYIFEKNYYEACIIHDLAKKYNVNVILAKSSVLNIYFDLIVSGMNTLEYHESQDMEITITNLLDSSSGLLRKDIPLVICPQSKTFIGYIVGICETYETPLFIASFYHLKYINFDTRIDSRYSYINVALSFLLFEIFLRSVNLNSLTKISYTNGLDLQFKKVELNGKYTINFCPYPKNLPNYKSIIFDSTYCNIKKINNITLYSDTAGTYKSTNLLVDWFNEKCKKSKNVVKICLFSCNSKNSLGENTDLIKVLTPLSTIDFETFYVVNYNQKGRCFSDIEKSFDNLIVEKYIDTYNWNDTIYEGISTIYNDEKYIYGRKHSIIRLNEYNGLDEVCVSEEKHQEIIKSIELPSNTNIVSDDLKSITEWIKKCSHNNPKNEYHILITGMKNLILDSYKLFEN